MKDSSAHFISAVWAPSNHGLDGSTGRFRLAIDECEILFLDLSSFKLFGELPVRQFVLCHNQHAAGVSIQSVHDAGANLSAYAAQIGTVV